MIKQLVTIVLFFFVTSLQAQTPALDSLHQHLSENITAKEKVDTYNQLAFKYLTFDSVKTAEYTRQAIDLAQKIQYNEGLADAYYAIGWVTMTFGHNQRAIELFETVLALSDSAQYEKGQANAHNGLGDANRNIGKFTAALEHHLVALQLREALKDQPRVASSFNNIGVLYYTLKDYERALEYYTKGLEIRKASNDLRQLAVSYNNIGIVLLAQSDYSSALNYYNQCLEINLELGNKSDVARNYHNIGVLYSDHLKEHAKGMEYYQKALQIYREIGDQASSVYPLMGVAGAYFLQEQWLKSKAHVQEAIKIANQAQLKSIEMEGYNMLAEVEYALGNYKSAFQAQKKHKTLSDTLRNEAQIRKLTLLEAEYKFEKERIATELSNEKEKLLISEALKKEKMIQYMAIAGAGILLVIVFILFRYYQLKKKANHWLTTNNLEISQHKDKLEKLNQSKSRFFSIISHDLRAPINTFFGMFNLIKLHLNEKYGAQKDQELQEMLGHLKYASDQLTNLLDNLFSWALKEEGKMLYNPELLDMHKCINETIEVLRSHAISKNIELVNLSAAGSQVWADKNSLMAILRNLTSNALKFTPVGGSVKLNAVQGDTWTVVTVQDDGVGIGPEALTQLFEMDNQYVTSGTKGEKGTGLGLTLVQDFVNTNKGSISVKSQLNIGTSFELKFPKDQNTL